jgi:aarF domain-containing kinase
MSSLIPRSAFSASASAHSLLLRRTAAAPWTCRSCSQTTQQNIFSQALRAQKTNFSTSQHVFTQAGKRAWREKLKSPRERRRVAIVATVLFIAGAGALAFSEQARHAYIACERSGRVGVTLAICVNE